MKGTLFNKKLYILPLLLTAIILSVAPVAANSSMEAITAIFPISIPEVISKNFTDYADLRIRLENYINTRPGKVSVYVEDLAQGKL